MTKDKFERLLDSCCEVLTAESRKEKFKSAKQFEERVRKFLSDSISTDDFLTVEFNTPAQAFPDIPVGEYGVEVKFTANDTWRSIANSILETQRVEGINYIYVVFGKMGGIPEVRWGEYEDVVIHVRTSHVPRFEVEMPADRNAMRESLFQQMGISYEQFRRLDMLEKMKYIRSYARKIHPDGRLWWIYDDNADEHTLPMQARLYTNLTTAEKLKLRAEAAIICPKIVKSGRDRTKYDDVVLYLLTYRGVLCHQARDLFSAGSVANPKNDDNGGIYIQRALKLIEEEMKRAAPEIPDSAFVEYWGESVPPEKRIQRWLEKADQFAHGWKPSEVLFTKQEL